MTNQIPNSRSLSVRKKYAVILKLKKELKLKNFWLKQINDKNIICMMNLPGIILR